MCKEKICERDYVFVRWGLPCVEPFLFIFKLKLDFSGQIYCLNPKITIFTLDNPLGVNVQRGERVHMSCFGWITSPTHCYLWVSRLNTRYTSTLLSVQLTFADITCCSAADAFLSSVRAKCHRIRAVTHYCEAHSSSAKHTRSANGAQKNMIVIRKWFRLVSQASSVFTASYCTWHDRAFFGTSFLNHTDFRFLGKMKETNL